MIATRGLTKRYGRTVAVHHDYRELARPRFTVRCAIIILALYATAMIGVAVLVSTTAPPHPASDYDPTEELFAGLSSASCSSASSAPWC